MFENVEPIVPSHVLKKSAERRAFLQTCSRQTTEIQIPIVDPFATRGHPNPKGLGDAQKFSMQGSWGQCSVLFSCTKDCVAAVESGKAPYGGSEYGITLTPEADAVCHKMAALHDGAGAVICPSGLSAIATTIEAFAPRAILVPDNAYGPVFRYLKRRSWIRMYRYPVGAFSEDVSRVLEVVLADGFAPADLMLYLEAPGSGTFEIPDIDGLVALAKMKGIRTAMDNTWASHVRFKPLEHGIDIAIQATTKYEGGYGDTPSGIVVAASEADYKALFEELQATGNGAVAPTTCARLFGRVDSAADRMDRQYETATRLAAWFKTQPFVARVLFPGFEDSPYRERFLKYFGKGNGLFSVELMPFVSSEKREAFIDALNLFWVGASWGGHVSLVLPFMISREVSEKPAGLVLRFHAGLEDPADLARDIAQAARAVFGA